MGKNSAKTKIDEVSQQRKTADLFINTLASMIGDSERQAKALGERLEKLSLLLARMKQGRSTQRETGCQDCNSTTCCKDS
jgi:hypothetical protein